MIYLNEIEFETLNTIYLEYELEADNTDTKIIKEDLKRSHLEIKGIIKSLSKKGYVEILGEDSQEFIVKITSEGISAIKKEVIDWKKFRELELNEIRIVPAKQNIINPATEENIVAQYFMISVIFKDGYRINDLVVKNSLDELKELKNQDEFMKINNWFKIYTPNIYRSGIKSLDRHSIKKAILSKV